MIICTIQEHCDSVDVQWATDKSEQAFAFVTILPKAKGKEVVDKLNGHEIMGRNIVGYQARDNNNKKTSGGKSARELRALAEEEEDAKKKKRRRPKKD